MNLAFKSKKLKKQCEDPREAQKEFGPQIGIKLTLRLNEFRAATNLTDIAKNRVINGFHPLKGDRSNEFAVTLKEPYRLIFTIDSGTDLENIEYNDIKFIKIEEVIDYHGKSKKK